MTGLHQNLISEDFQNFQTKLLCLVCFEAS
jgi:hypothetical protein